MLCKTLLVITQYGIFCHHILPLIFFKSFGTNNKIHHILDRTIQVEFSKSPPGEPNIPQSKAHRVVHVEVHTTRTMAMSDNPHKLMQTTQQQSTKKEP